MKRYVGRNDLGGTQTVVIDSFPESAVRYTGNYAVVCVDVLTSCSTILTALARGRRSFVFASLESVREAASLLEQPLLVGEMEGEKLEGFDLPDSPAAIDGRTDIERPLVLLSVPGTELIVGAGANAATAYTCCMRNLTATTRAVAAYPNVAVLGAGYHSEFSCEDQLATAWIANTLMRMGFEAGDLRTVEIVRRWRNADPSLIDWGNSAAHLRRANRADDVEFVLAHLDDLNLVCRYENGECVAEEPPLPDRRLPLPRAKTETVGSFGARGNPLRRT